ncbi:MAG: hypothetical protein ABIB46_06410 [bacterium]
MKQYRFFIYLLIGLFLFSCSLKKRNNIFDPKKEEVKSQVEIETGSTGRINNTTPILKLTSPWEKTDDVFIKMIGSDRELTNSELKGENSFFNKVPNWYHFIKTIQFNSSFCPIPSLTNEEKQKGGALRYIYVLFKGPLPQDEKIVYNTVILDQIVQFEFSIEVPATAKKENDTFVVGLDDKIIFKLKLKEEVLTVGKPKFNNIEFPWNVESRKENDGWVYESWYTIVNKPIKISKTGIKDSIDTIGTAKRIDANIMKNFYLHEAKRAYVSIIDKSGNEVADYTDKIKYAQSANQVIIKTRYICDTEIVIIDNNTLPNDYPCYFFNDICVGIENGTTSPILTIPSNAKIYFGVKNVQWSSDNLALDYSLCSLKVLKGALKSYSSTFSTNYISLDGWKTEKELPKWEGIYFGKETELSELKGCTFTNYNINPYSFYNNEVIQKVKITE